MNIKIVKYLCIGRRVRIFLTLSVEWNRFFKYLLFFFAQLLIMLDCLITPIDFISITGQAYNVSITNTVNTNINHSTVYFKFTINSKGLKCTAKVSLCCRQIWSLNDFHSILLCFKWFVGYLRETLISD